MNQTDAKTLKKWLDENGVKLLAFISPYSYIAVIHNPETGVYGMAEGGDFEETVRMAQLAYDAEIIEDVKVRARVVGLS